MKKIILPTIIVLFSVCLLSGSTGTTYNYSTIEQLRPAEKDIPTGFRFGLIPGFAKNLLKNNPWKLDRAAIKKLTQRIYPGGNQNQISDIHMTVFAKTSKPYGDDIVCYIFLFKNSKSAVDEFRKLKEHVNHNGDRAIAFNKKNIAVYFHIDDVEDYSTMKGLSEKIQKKLENI